MRGQVETEFAAMYMKQFNIKNLSVFDEASLFIVQQMD